MGVLIKPINIFPDENDPENSPSQDFPSRIKLLVEAVVSLEAAIKSTTVFPASEVSLRSLF